MYLVPGVDISKLTRPTRRSLVKVDYIFLKYGEHFVITSTYGGRHSPSSLHYSHEAYDCLPPAYNVNEIVLDIKESLGSSYDVVFEKDHIHIEYDPG